MDRIFRYFQTNYNMKNLKTKSLSYFFLFRQYIDDALLGVFLIKYVNMPQKFGRSLYCWNKHKHQLKLVKLWLPNWNIQHSKFWIWYTHHLNILYKVVKIFWNKYLLICGPMPNIQTHLMKPPNTTIPQLVVVRWVFNNYKQSNTRN